MDVSIIIVNWHSLAFLDACIRSVQRHTEGIDYEFVVIDSGSFDGCGDWLRRTHPQVRFVQSAVNLGFAAANNRAYQQARGRHLLFLNPDTELVSPAVNLMLHQLERCPQAGAVGARLLNGDGSLQTSCVQSFPTLTNQLLSCELLRRLFPQAALWGMGALLRPGNEPAAVQGVSGACLMVRRESFELAGLFSEDYFMYADDLDLCHKLQQAGYVNYYLPAAVVRHFGGGSTGSAPSEFSVLMMRESIWRFLHKTRGARYAGAYRATTLLGALLRLGVMLPACALAPLWRRLPPRTSVAKWRAILGWSLGMRRATRPT